jgi:hypothetical protein
MKVSDLIAVLTQNMMWFGDMEIRGCELQADDDYNPLFTTPKITLSSSYEGEKCFLNTDPLRESKKVFLVIE